MLGGLAIAPPGSLRRIRIPVYGPLANAPGALVDGQTPGPLWCKVAKSRKG